MKRLEDKTKLMDVLKEKYKEGKTVFIFDFDGTLINSEPIHFDAHKEVYKLITGKELGDEDRKNHAGGTNRETYEKLRKDTGIDFDIEWATREKSERALKLMKKEKLFDFFFDIVKTFPDTKNIIVSNQEEWVLKDILKYFDIAKYFEKTFSLSKILVPKPKFYDRLFEFTQIDYQNAIVFEDSQTVIDKAIEKGIFTVGIDNGYNSKLLKKADIIIKSKI